MFSWGQGSFLKLPQKMVILVSKSLLAAGEVGEEDFNTKSPMLDSRFFPGAFDLVFLFQKA